MIEFELKISGDSVPTTFTYAGSFQDGCKENWCGVMCQIGKAVAMMHEALRLACMGRNFKDRDTQNLMDLDPDRYSEVLERCLHTVETYNEKGYPIPPTLRVVGRKDAVKNKE